MRIRWEFGNVSGNNVWMCYINAASVLVVGGVQILITRHLMADGRLLNIYLTTIKLFNHENGSFLLSKDTSPRAITYMDEDAFPNMRVFLLIGCTLPITSAEAERSVSLFRRLKTHLRSRMTDARLSSLALLAMHPSIQLEPKDVTKRFII